MKDKKQGTGHTVLTLSILVVLGIFLVSAGLLCRSLYEYRKGEKEYGLLQRYAAKAPGREPESRSPYSLSAGEQKPMLAVDFEPGFSWRHRRLDRAWLRKGCERNLRPPQRGPRPEE